jgi:hypothetical protein
MKPGVLCAALALLSASASAAEPCMDNFKAGGNFLTGKNYKTWAVVSGVRQPDAFARALAFTVSNGFTVTASDKESGVISAAQTVSYGQGKTAPLSVVIQPDAGNLKISMSYATSGGVMSPEDAIRKHFCLTIAAASEGGSAAPAADNTGVVPPPNPNLPRRPAMRGFAAASDAQQAGFQQQIPKNVPNQKLRPMVDEAAPAIAAFIGQLACVVDTTGANALNAHAAPGIDLHNRYVGLHPMRLARYHDKSTCMSVSRVQGWKAPANNALQFEVVYKADDSGEISKLSHEAVRQPDGVWLFRQ